MSLADFRGKKNGFPLLSIFSIMVFLLAVLILGIELVRYSEYRQSKENTLPSNVSIGGVEVSNLDSNRIRERLEAVYVDQPIMLYYSDSPIIFRPSEIGFTLDIEAMLAAAQREDDAWAGFWDFLWRRPEGDVRRSDRVEVDLIASYAPIDLEEYLYYEVAARYDSAGGDVGFDITTLTFQGSQSSTGLDIDAAIDLIDSALYEPDPEKRRIELPLITSPGNDPTMETLEQEIINYLNRVGIPYNGTNSVVSVFVMDLATGEEMGIAERVPHSASSTIKVGILANYFRTYPTAPTNDVKMQLLSMIACSENGDANTLMDITALNGDSYQGMRNTNQTMCEMGAINSFIRSRLFIGYENAPGSNVPLGYYTIVGEPSCPAKGYSLGLAKDTTLNTYPDSLLQITASDMGTMLMMIYQCAKYNSGLRSVFPEEITQTECQWMIELLKGTHFLRLAELGIPEGVEFAHKVGYYNVDNGAAGNVADAGIVFSPGGDYIFVMYVWDAQMVYGSYLQKRWDLIADVSRITYNFFNPDAPMLQNRVPPNPNGGVGCVVPGPGAEIDLTDINRNRYGENGLPLPSACYGGRAICLSFTDWLDL